MWTDVLLWLVGLVTGLMVVLLAYRLYALRREVADQEAVRKERELRMRLKDERDKGYKSGLEDANRVNFCENLYRNTARDADWKPRAYQWRDLVTTSKHPGKVFRVGDFNVARSTYSLADITERGIPCADTPWVSVREEDLILYKKFVGNRGCRKCARSGVLQAPATGHHITCPTCYI